MFRIKLIIYKSSSGSLSIENIEDILVNSRILEREDTLNSICDCLIVLSIDKDSSTVVTRLLKNAHRYNSLVPKLSSILNTFLQVNDLPDDVRSKSAPQVTAFLQNVSSEQSKDVLHQLMDGIKFWFTKYDYDESLVSVITLRSLFYFLN